MNTKEINDINGRFLTIETILSHLLAATTRQEEHTRQVLLGMRTAIEAHKSTLGAPAYKAALQSFDRIARAAVAASATRIDETSG